MSLRQRPESFRLDCSHSLARGLVFAGLAGGCVGSKQYIDSSSRRNHGVLTNMSPADDWVWVDELGRWGLDFYGSYDHVNAPGVLPTISGSSDWTCSLWMRTTVAYVNYIIGNGTVGDGFYMRVGREVASAEDGEVIFKLDDGTNDAYFFTGPTVNVADGAWHHLVMVVRSGVLYGYVDGDSKNSADCSSVGPSGTLSLEIGRLDSENYTGSLSDTLIHDRALSPAEIAVLANPADPMLGGLLLPPKRKYYGIPYIRPGFRYKLGRLLLQRT